jgi:hypothetical protein
MPQVSCLPWIQALTSCAPSIRCFFSTEAEWMHGKINDPWEQSGDC